MSKTHEQIRKETWSGAFNSFMKKKAGMPDTRDAITAANEALNAFDQRFKEPEIIKQVMNPVTHFALNTMQLLANAAGAEFEDDDQALKILEELILKSATVLDFKKPKEPE